MRSKAPLAMMEQLVMLLVFALAAALCLQAFVKSDQMSGKMEARDRAVTFCQNTAEAIRRSEGDLEAALKTVSGAEPERNDDLGFYVDLDENWQAADSAESSQPSTYLLSAKALDSGTEGLGKANVEAFRWNNGELEFLFSIETAWQEVSVHG